ncbi:MAG: translation elongation factor-like protein [Candidatus Nanoarchaeia archaeon]|jgi:putative protease|nr:translation elongation factor-like protein [Candidatus Nanoarchaeia archaeon]|tara:strand:- start:1832 stop:2086 length:255 start_codon:yes stop_codon:yes gene_type:complete
MAGEKKIGKIFSYYANIGVAAIDLTDGALKTGDKIHIKGHTTDVTQTVDSMQVEHKEVKAAKKGSSVGIKVSDRVRPNDDVFKA